MIEKTAIDYLDTQLTEPVYAETPNPIPSTAYVIVEKTADRCVDGLWYSTLAIQSISDSLYNASTLNGTVITKMLGITSLNSISRCVLETSYNYTNTATKQYRYQAVFNLTYY